MPIHDALNGWLSDSPGHRPLKTGALDEEGVAKLLRAISHYKLHALGCCYFVTAPDNATYAKSDSMKVTTYLC